MSISQQVKKQLDSIKTKVVDAEKSAHKQIQSAIKNTEKFRAEQLKTVQGLIKKAQGMDQKHLIQKAESVRHEIEMRATAGFEILMAKLNVPSKKEIERLNKRVGALQKRIDELESKKSSATKH